MNLFTVRQIGVEDVEELQRVGRQTFSETFSEVNTEENMMLYLEEGFSKEKLEAEVSNLDSEFILQNWMIR